jgi:hypothetical protein
MSTARKMGRILRSQRIFAVRQAPQSADDSNVPAKGGEDAPRSGFAEACVPQFTDE